MSDATTKLERQICGLEAALYSAGRPLTLDEIKPVLRTKSDKVSNSIIMKLRVRYLKRGGALEIVVLNDGRVSMQLIERYDNLVKQYNNKPLLKLGPLKTLSYIAFHQPVDQRQVIIDRGSHVYAHIRMMENMGLITRQRTEDRSYLISTTPFYSDYFGFSHNPERSKLQLKQIFRDLKIHKLENGNIEIPSVDNIEGLEDLDDIESMGGEYLTHSGNRLTQGFSQYSSTADNGSQ